MQQQQILDDNRSSAFFPPLTMEDLNSDHKGPSRLQQQPQLQSASLESDFDMSISKLKYLGADISNLQFIDQQSPQEDRDEMRQRFNEFNKSIQTYHRKFDSNQESTKINPNFQDSNNQLEISIKLENFKQKIQDIQHELQSHKTRSPSSDPYKISLRSLHKPDQKYSDFKSTELKPYLNIMQSVSQNPVTTSLSSGGLSFQAPLLYSTTAKKLSQEYIPTQLSDLEVHRIKYYDSYLPEGQKTLNCAYKLLKHKIQTRDRTRLTRCLEDFNIIDLEISQSLKI